MKRRILYSLMALSFATPFLAGCDSQGKVDKNVSIADFTKTTDGFATKVNNDVATFSFISKVSVPNNYTWSLYYDFEATNEIVNKTIRCSLGNNRVYLLVYNQKDTLGFYNVDVYRYHMYSVNFNTNGGSYIQPQQVQEESYASRPSQDPTKNGYNFLGWDFDFSTPIMSNKTVNASWSANQYTITFDVNGGDELDTDTLVVTYGSYCSLPTPVWIGHTFLGWYSENTKYNSGTWATASNITLTAKWEINVYKITYNPNGGTMSPSSAQQSVTYGEDYQLNSAFKTGYTFDGWFFGETKFESGTWTFENDVELDAHWTPNTYKITYILNEGTQSEGTIQEVVFDSQYTLTIPSREGHTFDGWYYDDVKIVSGIWKYDHDITLDAHWTPNTYLVTPNIATTENVFNVTFDYNDESGNTKVVQLSGKESNKLEYFVPDNTETSVFCGWYLDKDCTEYFEFSDSGNSISCDTTLYAKWYKRKHGKYDPVPIKYGEKVDVETEITKYDRIYGTGDCGVQLFAPLEKTGVVITIYSTVALDVQLWRHVNKYAYQYPESFSSKTYNILGNNSWKYTLTLTGDDISSGDVYSVRAYASIDDSGMIKSWELQPYTGSIVSNICLSDSAIKDISVVYGNNYFLGVPVLNESQFVGWYTEPNGGGVRLTHSDGNSIEPYKFTDSIIAYAYFG